MASGRVLVAGRATGPALVLDEPLSLWGGLDPQSGRIIDEHHPQRGEVVAGRVLVMPGGRGSSSSSSVLAEAIRAGRGPAAVLLGTTDEIVALGALVAVLLYDLACPVLELPADVYTTIASGDLLAIAEDGSLEALGPGALT
jgi:predicted aconitase with swiveling domain